MEEKEYRDKIRSALNESAEIKKKIADECIDDIIEAAKIIVACFNKGFKLMLCGNGGSAADAQHIAGEFVVRLTSQRNRHALPALSLSTDTSIITACSNDYGFESIFLRQVEALSNIGDVLIGITTSGNSPNVINALKRANDLGVRTISFLGAGGGKVKGICDVDIIIPGNHVCRIQEGHSVVGHILCDTVESMMFEED